MKPATGSADGNRFVAGGLRPHQVAPTSNRHRHDRSLTSVGASTPKSSPSHCGREGRLAWGPGRRLSRAIPSPAAHSGLLLRADRRHPRAVGLVVRPRPGPRPLAGVLSSASHEVMALACAIIAIPDRAWTPAVTSTAGSGRALRSRGDLHVGLARKLGLRAAVIKGPRLPNAVLARALGPSQYVSILNPAAEGRSKRSSLERGVMPRPSSVCRCGHPLLAHEHFRRGTECVWCPPGACVRFRRHRVDQLGGLIGGLRRSQRRDSRSSMVALLAGLQTDGWHC